MQLFRVDASILPATSSSAELADIVEAEWTSAHTDGEVVRRHLGTDPVPADAWTAATLGGFSPEEERTDRQREALDLAARLSAELADADAVILAVPLYNWGVSQHFKAWADLVITGAGTGVPILEDTPTVLVTVRGGGYGPGTPKEGWDHSTPYLRRLLADAWGADLTVIERELTLAAMTPAMEPLRPEAERLHAEARALAERAGKELAGRVPAVQGSTGV
ncbi:FMN-dependent NADH-azoreductase [Nocardiopsis sp. MG754419]|uniref:FMN-dependent NADH-azoreductase n=1 Tax=Nocardiopsis sp. MG754419 TaxID=2259865 RepID=UPI001BA7688B|nr:NAD(P)H-dependent oxidoreductase [Nocardiopsis sp. MG754419]MBR8742851.1 flavodoxin family protein [Nocardiopsis sp. MG754419]